MVFSCNDYPHSLRKALKSLGAQAEAIGLLFLALFAAAVTELTFFRKRVAMCDPGVSMWASRHLAQMGLEGMRQEQANLAGALH